jgi:type I site-specific restriction-modification system R (restriction) subunit
LEEVIMKTENESIFGEVIYAYTRAQAIEDGVLVDVTTTASEAGFKWPAAMTRTVYERYIEVPSELNGQQDIQGRLWDLMPST